MEKICQSVFRSMSHLQNYSVDFDEIWYGGISITVVLTQSVWSTPVQCKLYFTWSSNQIKKII